MVFCRRAVLALLVTTSVGASWACREQPSAQQPPAASRQAESNPVRTGLAASEAAEPARETDRVIRRELHTVIAQDPALKSCAISVAVDNGDITVTGTVPTETERQKINELAMQINGVKSVANALRVSQDKGGN
jgi:osmotically-inducible protein OsmY